MGHPTDNQGNQWNQDRVGDAASINSTESASDEWCLNPHDPMITLASDIRPTDCQRDTDLTPIGTTNHSHSTVNTAPLSRILTRRMAMVMMISPIASFPSWVLLSIELHADAATPLRVSRLDVSIGYLCLLSPLGCTSQTDVTGIDRR